MIRIRNLVVPFTETASLEDLAAKRLRLPPQQIAGVVIVRKAVDARRYHGAPINFVYMLDVESIKAGEKGPAETAPGPQCRGHQQRSAQSRAAAKPSS